MSLFLYFTYFRASLSVVGPSHREPLYLKLLEGKYSFITGHKQTPSPKENTDTCNNFIKLVPNSHNRLSLRKFFLYINHTTDQSLPINKLSCDSWKLNNVYLERKKTINIFPKDSKRTWNLNEQFLLQSIIQCIKIIKWEVELYMSASYFNLCSFKHLMRLFHPHSINTTKASFRFTRWFLYLFDVLTLADKKYQSVGQLIGDFGFLYWPWQTSVCWPFHWRPWVWVPVRPSCCGRDGRLSGVARGRAAGGGSWPGSCDVSAHTWHSHPPSSSTPSGPPSRKQTSQNDQFCLVLALYSRKRKHYNSCQYSLLSVHCQNKILITVVFHNTKDFHCKHFNT